MSLVAYAGPETGQRDRASYMVQQGKVRFVFTTPLRASDPIAEHIHRHGDGVRVIALWVDDAHRAWRETTNRGAISVAVPYVKSDEYGRVVLSSIRAYGDTIHTFVERDAYAGPFLPGFRPIESDPVARPVGLLHIDHMVGNVGWHEMDRWVDFYSRVMGFRLYQHFDDKDISTEYSALMSKVHPEVLRQRRPHRRQAAPRGPRGRDQGRSPRRRGLKPLILPVLSPYVAASDWDISGVDHDHEDFLVCGDAKVFVIMIRRLSAIEKSTARSAYWRTLTARQVTCGADAPGEEE